MCTPPAGTPPPGADGGGCCCPLVVPVEGLVPVAVVGVVVPFPVDD